MKTRLTAVIVVVVAGLSILMGPAMAWAQAPYTPLPLGTVINVASTTCPPGYASGTSCFSATVTCPSTVNLGFIYGEIGSGSAGTIVMFNGGAGNKGPGGTNFAADYVNKGFNVVQVVWNTAWELTGNGSGVSIKTAGCRPATVLNYVWKNIYTNTSGTA